MSVTKRKQTGKWQARVYYLPGKQVTKSFARKADAERWEADQLAKVNRGDWTNPQRAKVPVGSVYKDWIKAKVDVSDRTRGEYREVWRNVLAPFWDEMRLDQVKPSDVSRWLATDKVAKSSHARKQKAVTTLNQIFAWAVKDELISLNPVDRAKALSGGHLLPKAGPRKPNRYLTRVEVDTLAAACSDYSTLILTMAFTGLRWGEVSALQVRDVDLTTDKAQVTVQRAYTRNEHGKTVLGPPKSGKSRRVPLPANVARLLAVAVEGRDATAPVFMTQGGTPLDYTNFRRRVMDPAAVRAKLEGVTPHVLRHTYAALAVQAGATPARLKAAMGHESYRMTMDLYGGLFDSDLGALAEALDKGFSVESEDELRTNGADVMQFPGITEAQ